MLGGGCALGFVRGWGSRCSSIVHDFGKSPFCFFPKLRFVGWVGAIITCFFVDIHGGMYIRGCPFLVSSHDRFWFWRFDSWQG